MGVHINQAVAESLGLSIHDARGVVERLLSHEPTATLKHDQRSTVCRHDLDSRSWVVKTYHPPVLKRLLYGLVRRTAPWQEWFGGKALDRVGIRLSMPLAIVHPDTLVLPYQPGVTLDQWMRDTADRNQRLTVARQIGRQMGRMTAGGWINRDYKPTNLIIDEPCERGRAEPMLIDPAGIRRRRPAKIMRMFAVLCRSTDRAGGISVREGLTTLRAAIRTDPTLTQGRAAPIAREVLAMVDARPASDDPADSV